MINILSSNALVNLADRAMGLAVRRQALIAANLANLDTPGYRTQDLDFEQSLRLAMGQGQGQSLPMARTHGLHLRGTGGFLAEVTHPGRPNTERNDGNDVSLDRETLLLARTQGTYQISAAFIQGEVRKLRQAISESVAH